MKAQEIKPPTETHLKRAFARGQYAFDMGLTQKDNPYPCAPQRHVWNNGWTAAYREARDSQQRGIAPLSKRRF